MGTSIVLGEELARGGEGTIFSVENRKDWVAKIYGPTPHPGYEQKLLWMKNHPPENSAELRNAAVLAWPFELLYDENGLCLGYLMNYVQKASPVLDIFNPRRRTQKFPGFHRKLIYQTARNIALALSKLHDRGYVVGDLNESNILVTSNGLVTIIDNDSFQVQEVRRDGIVVYPCSVGKPDYTPPELQGKALDGVLRRPEHDCFSLAVLIFQMLMDGNHPFRSRWLKSGEPPSLEEKINLGYFPYARKHRRIVQPPPNAPTLKVLYPKIEALFRRCFTEGVHDMRMRPTALEWANALAEAESSLISCAHDHYFSNHLLSCPDCTERESAVGRSLWMASSVPLIFSSERFTSKQRPWGRALRITSGITIGVLLAVGVVVMAAHRWMSPPKGKDNHAFYTVSGVTAMAPSIPSHVLAINKHERRNKDEELKEGNSKTDNEQKDEVKTEEPKEKQKPENPPSPPPERVAAKEGGNRPEHPRKPSSEPSRRVSETPNISKNPGRISLGTADRLTPYYTLMGHMAAVACVSFSPSGEYLATGSLDATARIWRVKDGQALQTIKDKRKIMGIAFSPDGKTIASGSKDINLWNTFSGAQAGTLSMKRVTTCLSFSPDGKILACGSTDNKVRLWIPDSNTSLQVLEGHTGNINAVAFSPDGQILASGSNDNTVRLWRVQDGALIHTLKAPCWDITSLAFSPGGTYLAAGSRDCTIRLWRVDTGNLESTLNGHQQAVTCVSFSPDGKMIVSGSEDQTLRLWQVWNGDAVKSFKTNYPIKSLSFSPNGTFVASGLSNGMIQVWGLGQ